MKEITEVNAGYSGRHCVNSNYFIHYISFHNLNYTSFAALPQSNQIHSFAAALAPQMIGMICVRCDCGIIKIKTTIVETNSDV